MGAGVLPLSIYKNTIFLLLGQERHNGLWSDFGGSPIKGETNLDTAIREGYEELNGFLGSKQEMKKTVVHNLLMELDNKDRYTTFVFKTKYSKSLPLLFSKNNLFIEENLDKELVNGKNGLFEKSSIKWFPIDYFENNENRKIIRPYYYPIIETVTNNKDIILLD
jgi:8-oxo-dGTP pyrophosphatase MutT (NUDIX family)